MAEITIYKGARWKLNANSVYLREPMEDCICHLLYVPGKGYLLLNLNSKCPCPGHGIHSLEPTKETVVSE